MADSDQVMALLGYVSATRGGKYSKKQPEHKRENVTISKFLCLLVGFSWDLKKKKSCFNYIILYIAVQIVVLKWILSPDVQEANPHTELRYLTYLQFCTEKGSGWQIHKASTTTAKTFH